MEIACIRKLEKKTVVSPIYVSQRRHQEVNDGAQLKLVAEQRVGVQSMMAPILGGSLVLADCCYACVFLVLNRILERWLLP